MSETGFQAYCFCPKCGNRLTITSQPDDHRPRLRCPGCGFVVYQNSKPCAGALVVRDGKVLLARRAIEPFLGQWDIPGGFLEFGEHPLDGACRELREETGLEILPKALLGIYMDTYGSDADVGYTLNIYYVAEPIGGEPRAADDVAALSWFGPDELPEQIAFQHCRQVLEDWRKECPR